MGLLPAQSDLSGTSQTHRRKIIMKYYKDINAHKESNVLYCGWISVRILASDYNYNRKSNVDFSVSSVARRRKMS